MTEEPKLRGRAKLVVGALFVACGIYPIIAAVGTPEFSAGKNAPDWVVGLAGLLFVLGGGAVWAQGTAAEKLVGSIVGTAALLGLAAIGNWIAFGAGERACSASSTSWLFSREFAVGEWSCRAAFGAGAALLDGFLVLGLAKLLQARFGSRSWTVLLEKLAGGVVLVVLSPLLLLLIVIALVQGGKEALLEGRWFKRRDRA